MPGLELRRRVDAIIEAADSFRVRAFFTGEKEIVDAGKFSKEEYERYLDYLLEDEFKRRFILGIIKESEGLTIEEIVHRAGVPRLEVIRHVDLLRYEKLVEFNYDGLIVSKKEETRSIPYEKVRFIVEEGLCTGCGGCIAACPVCAIAFVDEKPIIDESKCVGCGVCNIHCPRTFFPISLFRESVKGDPVDVETEGLSFFRQAYTAQTAKEKVKQVCQDGGVVTSILAYLFEKEMIDCAVGVRKADESWRTQA
ncbi:MAG: 4Fe-4S binding protein, partial [Candidatus Freyarchaeota archaeon]|nr:4Fe-4S binding protein [Candidatus Jordarchaeia archaeon]